MRSPPLKHRLVPHPAMNDSASSSRPRKNGWARTRSLMWSSSNASALPPDRPGPDGPYLFGDVDPDRTPRDAAAAPDAARDSELVDPTGQLVRHPLPVPGPGGGPHRMGPHPGEVEGEARIPRAPAFGVFTGEVGHVLHRAAETGRADQRAVGAGQTPLRHVVPAGMFGVGVEEVPDAVGPQLAAHRPGGGVDHVAGRGAVGRPGR